MGWKPEGADHNVASHSDTTATGAELDTLTDGSETALHSHAGGGAGAYSPLLDVKGSTDDPPDDEFDDTAGMSGVTNGLDAKWTAVAGVAGTVDLMGKPTTNSVYDFTTRSGWMLLQGADSARIRLRQDWTMADGESIIMAFAWGGGDWSSGATPPVMIDNLGVFKLALNDNNTDEGAGNDFSVVVQVDAGGWSIQNVRNGTIRSLTDKVVLLPDELMYFRIARDGGSTYRAFYSTKGATWMHLDSGDPGATLDNLWITFATNVVQPAIAPISAIHWIRQGTNALDPW
jgi:hypothetical protein